MDKLQFITHLQVRKNKHYVLDLFIKREDITYLL